MKMKPNSILIVFATGIAALFFLTSCGQQGGHDHAGHDHESHEGHDHDDHEGHDHDDHEGHDHDDHEGHDHADHEGHDHGGVVAGPNGGRVLMGVEPHAEFKVTPDRKVTITFVDDDLKPVAAVDQSVSVIAGDRSNPTRMAFAKSGDVLQSDSAFPAGNDFPVVVQIKVTPEADTVVEKFNLNLNDCPTCEYLEYACTCAHAH